MSNGRKRYHKSRMKKIYKIIINILNKIKLNHQIITHLVKIITLVKN